MHLDLNMIQAEFQDYILTHKQDIRPHISNNAILTAETGLKIYHQAYYIKLQTALAENYPVLKLYLGNINFSKLCLGYINTYRSNFFSIRYFGDKLADYICENKSFSEHLFLSELAKFEWLMSLVFDAADSNDIADFSVIAKLSPEAWPGMRLQMQPSLYRINLNYNTVKIWQAIMEEDLNIENPQIQPISYWLLWRQGLMTRYCALSQTEAWAIDGFISKLSFREICEGLCQYVKEQEVGPLAGAFLQNWLLGELIAKVIV